MCCPASAFSPSAHLRCGLLAIMMVHLPLWGQHENLRLGGQNLCRGRIIRISSQARSPYLLDFMHSCFIQHVPFSVGPSEMRAAYYYDGASSPYGVSTSISALVDKSCAERGSERSAPKPVRHICLTSCTLDLSNVRFFVPVGPSAMRVAYY